MGTRREVAKAATRAKILVAAKALFERDGYDAATIRDIANTAGVSTGAFFTSWPDKASAYREIFGHAPVSPEIGAGLLAVARRAIAGAPFDRDMAAALVAQVEEA